MICKRCQSELPDNSRFCLTCGALQPMICPLCQAESRPGSRTCSGCGKKLPNAGSAIQFYKRKKTPGEIAAMILLVVGAVLVLTAAILFLIKTVSDVSEPKEPSKPDLIVDAPVEKEPEKDPILPVIKPEIDLPEGDEDDPDATEEDNPETDTPEEDDPETDTPEEDKPEDEEPAKDPNAEWIFPDSSERLLTDADIAGMSKQDLRIARNEIYARHGYIFGSADLKAYFSGCSWYKGTTTKANFDEEAIFNDTEIANTQFLLKAEKKMG